MRIDTVIDSRINVYTDSEVDTSSDIGFSINTVSTVGFLIYKMLGIVLVLQIEKYN